MKKQIIKITRNALAALLVLFTAGTTMAQVHSLQLSMQNVTNQNPNTVEFELWIKDLSPDSTSLLSFLQFGIDLPAGIGNGGTLSCSKIAFNPLLPSSQQAVGAPAVQGQPSAPTIRVASQTTTPGLASAIPNTGNGIWYATYRITNTQNFAQNAVMTFTPVANQAGAKTRTIVAAYVNGSSNGVSYTVAGSTPAQSALRVLNILPYPSITLNQPVGTCPTAGNANVTDPICFGGLGSADITLSPVPVPVSGSYSVDGGTAASYTTNPFTVSGLSQGSHTVTVTNDPNCAPFDVVFTVGGPSSNPTNTTTQSACDSYTWSVTGMSYTQTGTYTGTSVNSQGCTVDEILDLTITPSTSNTTVASACDSYTWSVDNMMYTQSGTYTSVNGCHTEILDLTITPTTTNTTVASGCDSYTWTVNGMMYTMSGTYSEVSPNNPCHTEILDLTITPSTSNTTVASGCDSYTWSVNNMMYTQSGTYSEVSTTNPCHTEILELTITPSTSNTTVASACDSYTWSVNSTNYTQSGTYTSVNGCHTEILDLTITPSTTNTTVASGCDSYTWSVTGGTYTQSGTYSNVGLTITLSDDYFMDEVSWVLKNSSNVVIASGGPYPFGSSGGTAVHTVSPSASDYPVTFEIEAFGTFNDNEPNYTVFCNATGSTLLSGTLSGTFWGGPGSFTSGTLSCPAATGCVTEILDLTITPSTSNTTVASACDSYTWSVNNMMYTQSGTYTEVSSTNPCHTEILELTITPTTTNTTVASACDSYTWSVNGMMYTMSGTYSEVSTTNPCHTEILDLTITPTTTNTTVASGCDSYTWSVNGMMYTMSGTYSEVSPNNPCHTEILDLTITPSTSNTTVASACDSYTWSVNGMMYTMSGTYSEVSTTNPCHTEILDLTITPTTSNTTVASACDSYTWSVNGMMYTMSGTYSEVSPNNPCHTEILDLTITPSTSNTTVASACDSYTWSVDNMMYTMSGTYTSVNGCHTEILDLTITPSTSNTTVASACDSYTWSVNGMMYTMSGTYSQASTTNPCHTEILDLTITPSTTNTTVASACDSYTWSVNGMMYTMSGTYSEVSPNNPCHTEILDLTITPSTSNTTVATGCDSYTWSVNNMMYTMSGTYTSVNGCHTEILDLTLGQSTSSTITANAPVSYTWACDNVTYTQSGTYTCTGVNSTGCPDVQTLILTIGGCNLNVTTANASGCPGAPIMLTGSPAGGTWSVANPYVGPSTTFTYTYTDPNTGCTGTATGTITVANLAAVTITSVNVTGPTTATVNWTPVAGLGWYEVRYRPIGSGSWTGGGTQAAPTTFKNLIGLTAGTTYEVEVRGFCSMNNPGPWGSNTVFTTTGACGTPSGLFAAPVTGTTATLNWVAVPGATHYQFRMRKVGVLAWTPAGTQAAPATSKNIIGLTLNTQYEWQVRAVCNGAPSAWSAIDMFTTLASKQSVDFATETINNNVSVYPNPVRDVLTVEVTTEVAQNTVVKVFDMSGRLVKQIQANAEIGVNNIAVNLSDVSAGVYQVQVFANDKLTHISKVSKQD
jgi:hypothetical protein